MASAFLQNENVNTIYVFSDVVFLTKSKTKQSEKKRGFLLRKKEDIVKKETLCKKANRLLFYKIFNFLQNKINHTKKE